MVRIKKATDTKVNMCDFCGYEFATCPKANHIKFGDGKGNDNVIECSEYIPKQFHNNYPIEASDVMVDRVSAYDNKTLGEK